MSEQIAYRAGPWKCPLSWCHDSEQHHHSNASLIAKIAALESSLEAARNSARAEASSAEIHYQARLRLESSLRDRDKRVKALEGAVKDVVENCMNVDDGCAKCAILGGLLSPAPAAKEAKT